MYFCGNNEDQSYTAFSAHLFLEVLGKVLTSKFVMLVPYKIVTTSLTNLTKFDFSIEDLILCQMKKSYQMKNVSCHIS